MSVMNTPTLTHDYRYTYRGYHTDGAVCRVQVFERGEESPVFLVTELPENTNTSITNMAEYLAAELIGAHFPERLLDGLPVVWIERYLRLSDSWSRRFTTEDWSLVAFQAYTPRTVWVGGVWREELGAPLWTHVTPAEIRALTGMVVAS